MSYLHTKFHDNWISSFWWVAMTRFLDGRTDAQTDGRSDLDLLSPLATQVKIIRISCWRQGGSDWEKEGKGVKPKKEGICRYRPNGQYFYVNVIVAENTDLFQHLILTFIFRIHSFKIFAQLCFLKKIKTSENKKKFKKHLHWFFFLFKNLDLTFDMCTLICITSS